jgi:chromosome partition protein MukE
MDNPHFQDLGSAIEDARFADVDMALRRGRHIDREDSDWYAYLLDAQVLLESFYRRFGCELVYRSDGYFFLLPTGEKLGKRQLSVAEMLVGQGVALLYLDPRTIESGGIVTRDTVLGHLATVMGTDALVHAFSNPKRKRVDERVAQEGVRTRVAEALRKLANLGFVDLLEGDQIRLRLALMRFAEPVRGTDSPAAALEKLVARGEIAMGPSLDSEEGADESAVAGDDEGEADLEPSESQPEESEPGESESVESRSSESELTAEADAGEAQPEAAQPSAEQDDDEEDDEEGGFDAWGLDDDFDSKNDSEPR